MSMDILCLQRLDPGVTEPSVTLPLLHDIMDLVTKAASADQFKPVLELLSTALSQGRFADAARVRDGGGDTPRLRPGELGRGHSGTHRREGSLAQRDVQREN